MKTHADLKNRLKSSVLFLDPNCEIWEIIFVKYSTQVEIILEKRNLGKFLVLIIRFCFGRHLRQLFEFFIIAVDKILPGKFAHCS